jgi:hypothetical protein
LRGIGEHAREHGRDGVKATLHNRKPSVTLGFTAERLRQRLVKRELPNKRVGVFTYCWRAMMVPFRRMKHVFSVEYDKAALLKTRSSKIFSYYSENDTILGFTQNLLLARKLRYVLKESEHKISLQRKRVSEQRIDAMEH